MRKLKAYTLVEILVALTITSIIMVLAITVYFQLVRSNNQIFKDYHYNARLIELNSALTADFNRFSNIEYSIYELTFGNKDHEIEYEFSHIGIIRKFNERVDTFKFQYSELEYQLQNGNTGNVTELSFNVSFHKEKIPFSFYKEYKSGQTVNQKIF